MADSAVEESQLSHDTTISDSESALNTSMMDIEDKEVRSLQGDLDEARTLIEQLKHDILMLQEWKTEVGIPAVETSQTLQNQIEIVEQSSHQYQLELEGIQLDNQSMNQQIKAYRDEIDSLKKERSKMETQITELETQMNDQYLITASITAKDEQIAASKLTLEATKLSLQNCRLELKTLRKEHEEIRAENEQYQLVIQQHEEQQTKLEQQLVDRQREVAAVKMKYSDISAKLQRETVETRQQLRAAEQVASGLSDQLKEIESYQNSARNSQLLAPTDMRDMMPCGMPLFEKRKTLLIKEEEQSLKLPAMMNNRSMDMTDMLESMDVATSATALSSANVSRRASMRSNRSMLSCDFSDDELAEFRERAQGAAGANGAFARRMSSLRRLAPVNEFNDSEIDCDEKTVIVRRPSAALSAFEDEKDDGHTHRRRRGVSGVSAPSSVCDSEDDRIAMGYDEFVKNMRCRDDETESRRRGVSHGNVTKEIRIDISGSTHSNGSQPRTRSRSRAATHLGLASDEDEVDKLLRRLSGQSFNKYRSGKMVAMDPETRDNLKVEILGHIERLKREYERQQEAEKIMHRRQMTLWEEKYRSLKRDHKKMKSVQRRQKAKELNTAPNCTTFWSWGLQRKGCVPLKPPQQTTKARPYRSAQSKLRKGGKRAPKGPRKRRKRNMVVAVAAAAAPAVPVGPAEKKEESGATV